LRSMAKATTSALARDATVQALEQYERTAAANEL
jgi:hypothetical protein